MVLASYENSMGRENENSEENDYSPAVNYLKQLAESGMADVHVIQRETARKVLTEKRTELLSEVLYNPAESVRELARNLERDPGRVSEDLKVLYKAEIIDYEEGEGRAKRPVLAHKNVHVTPIIYDGELIEE